jgi:DNA polymerase-3 subunit gamma/tau
MSYQVLARKWRPKTFQDMVGQQHVLKALTNALDNGRLHHAYLFTGTRGVGKTTLARILAKCLNCEKGVSSQPCGECSACVGIDEGRFIDLIEVDAASRAKVDETRDLMDNVQYAPSVGRYKVYLIDEVHMFSGHSFNALLKTLEEPPPHVKFLLATTEAKKIPITILSRCLQFNLKHLSVTQIEDQLTQILAKENTKSDPNSRHLIAVAADGSLRDALSLLDQAISHGGGVLQEEQVRSMLGTIDSQDLKKLLKKLIGGDAHAVLQHVDAMAEYGPDYDSILIELLSSLQQIAVCQVLGDETENTSDEIRTLAKETSNENIQLYYQIGLMGRRDLVLAPDQRSGFEMILIRMLAFIPAEQVAYEDASAPLTSSSTHSEGIKQKDDTKQPTQNIQEDINSEVSSSDWQVIIDEMALAGLVKELAGHCVLKEHTHEKIHLILTPAQEHLLNTSQKRAVTSSFKNTVW